MQRIAVMGLLAISLSACTYRMSDTTIDRAEKRWVKASVNSYSFDLRIHAFMVRPECSEKGVLSVVVRDSQLTSYGKCAAPPADEANYASIPGLFKLMRDAKDGGAPGVKADFDAQYGFPQTIEIVVMRWATDSTFSYYVSNFQRLPE